MNAFDVFDVQMALKKDGFAEYLKQMKSAYKIKDRTRKKMKSLLIQDLESCTEAEGTGEKNYEEEKKDEKTKK